MKKSLLTFCAIAGLGLQAMAQGSNFWTPQATGFATPGRAINDISIPTQASAWAIAFDVTTADAPSQDFTRTTNNGTNWTPGTITAAGTNFTTANISAVDANTAWVSFFDKVNERNGKIFKTTDGGATWTQQATSAFTATSSFLNIVHMFDQNKGWAQGDPVGGEFEMYTTVDGGTTWTQVPAANIPNPLSGEFGTVDVYTTVGNNIIYFGTNRGRIFKSTDAGLTWTVTGTTGLTSISDVVFSNANYGLARTGTDLVKTTDGGATWSSVPYIGTLHTTDMTYVPGTTNTFVSVGASTTSLGSSYSTDGGLTWYDLDTTDPRIGVAFFSTSVGYAGGFNLNATTDGIFKFTGTVGISNKEFSKNIKVYPNPSNGLVNVELGKANGNQVSINVTDALGRSVFVKEATTNGGAYNTQLDLSNLKAGVYMLQVKTGENISNRKIVIE